MAKRLVEAEAIRGVSIIGQPGGWSVMLKLSMSEKLLGTQRTGKPRLWRSLDRCIEYVTSELRLFRFDLLDATNYSYESATRQARPDAAERMRKAHEAAAHEQWFREQTALTVKEADDPNTEWVSHEAVKADMQFQRENPMARITKGE
ncbi:hypothetical protein ACFQNF_15975 [Iodobacter arcticus]|uniref:Uncharacterized protein n=1 Tax=Iodobacter arcticus TaxID=590593 RepID=A0ABW2R141_9NEIS